MGLITQVHISGIERGFIIFIAIWNTVYYWIESWSGYPMRADAMKFVVFYDPLIDLFLMPFSV
jgi:hypothetical protein